MGLYEKHVFPLLNEAAMSDPQLRALRKEVLAGAHGRVLEVGIGTGLNLPFYPSSGVHSLVGIDPNFGMHKRAQARAAAAPFPVEVRGLAGESLPFETASFDTLVSTFVLCSIQSIERALAEMRRVLKPTGRFLLLEHGVSDEPKIRQWQRRLNPIQKVVACGCVLDRDVPLMLTEQGFRFDAMRSFLAPGIPRTHGFFYLGDARPV
jgi:ubiquinone/menaquinone biosynthesis C-methylase UbiE